MANRNRATTPTPNDADKNKETEFDDQYEEKVKMDAAKQDDVDAIPDELLDDTLNTTRDNDVRPTSYAANGSQTGTGMSLDELNEIGFDLPKAETERKKLDNPTGDWDKTDRWEFEKRVYAGDCLPGDRDPAGRTVFTFSGKPKTRIKDDIEYTPMLFLRVSPDYRASLNDPNKADGSYRLFLKALDMYLDIHGEQCISPRQMIHMLENDEYVIRTSNYQGNTNIVDVKKKQVAVGRRRG